MTELKTKRLVLFTLIGLYLLYSWFVYTNGTETQYEITSSANQGKQLFQQKNCIACHQIYGLGGYMGPDLTNVMSRRGDAYCRALIQAGTDRMPGFQLEINELNNLIDYLSFVDSTADYSLKNYETTWYGTVSRK